MVKIKSRAQQFAELSNQVSQEFDPEEDALAQNSDDNSEAGDSEDDLAGTEHYLEVSKSKLRKPDEASLGPKYAGSRISREALLDDDNDDDEEGSLSDDDSDSTGSGGAKFADPDMSEVEVDEEDGDIDSDVAFGESDSEKFKKFAFRGSSKPAVPIGHKPRPTAEDFMTDSEGENPLGGSQGGSSEEDEDMFDDEDGDGDADIRENSAGENSDEEDNSEDEDGSDDESEAEDDDRSELKKIMNEEEKTVVATISQAAKADADKGNAVKQQRKMFDAMLSTRMVLQKGVIAINTMAPSTGKDGEEIGEEAYHGAEEAAIKLWNILDGMRQNLIKSISDGKTGQKRKRAIESSASSDKIWERMQALEVASIDSRQTVLEKWWVKAKGPSAPLTGKLNNNVTPMSLTSLLQDHLAKSEPLEKTKRPRSCAPVQEKLKLVSDENIYDDTTLYKTLLNQLVDQRKMDSGNLVPGAVGPAQWAVKEAKMRKVVDRKASKGRKLRFTVHEKLQNFMAPEDRASWEPQAVDRFFGTLLGQKMTLKEDMDDDEKAEEGAPEEEGLRLFA